MAEPCREQDRQQQPKAPEHEVAVLCAQRAEQRDHSLALGVLEVHAVDPCQELQRKQQRHHQGDVGRRARIPLVLLGLHLVQERPAELDGLADVPRQLRDLVAQARNVHLDLRLEAGAVADAAGELREGLEAPDLAPQLALHLLEIYVAVPVHVVLEPLQPHLVCLVHLGVTLQNRPQDPARQQRGVPGAELRVVPPKLAQHAVEHGQLPRNLRGRVVLVGRHVLPGPVLGQRVAVVGLPMVPTPLPFRMFLEQGTRH
mmetsp:Transcript_114813/g.335781  ORF Transcript_114813/g.335781 Transcript_114813/m.335781 type:complete len:258 (+) Transcript_114813:97-870(+)